MHWHNVMRTYEILDASKYSMACVLPSSFILIFNNRNEIIPKRLKNFFKEFFEMTCSTYRREFQKADFFLNPT